MVAGKARGTVGFYCAIQIAATRKRQARSIMCVTNDDFAKMRKSRQIKVITHISRIAVTGEDALIDVTLDQQ